MTVQALVYSETGGGRLDVETERDLETARDAAGNTWIRAWNATSEELERVCDVFGIHDLELEDVTNGVRPKLEEYETHTFVLAAAAKLRRGETTFEEEIREDTVGLFVGHDWFVTLSTTEVGSVRRIWDAVTEGEARLLARGPDFTAYRILDGIVDDYYTVLDEIEDDIEAVESTVLEAPDEQTLETINSIRRELLSIRKLLWPMRDAMAVASRGDPDHVQERTEKYYRDVYDHLVQLVELTETYRELASGARDIYLNALSMSTNEVMKRLTVVATIVLPLTFIAGVYGMNFDGSPFNMPELGYTFGYPAVMLGMLSVTVILVAYFRREGWL